MYYINLSEDKKTKKKQMMLDLEIEVCQTQIDKVYIKYYCCKWKNLLNYLVNGIEELKNVCLNK